MYLNKVENVSLLPPLLQNGLRKIKDREFRRHKQENMNDVHDNYFRTPLFWYNLSCALGALKPSH